MLSTAFQVNGLGGVRGSRAKSEDFQVPSLESPRYKNGKRKEGKLYRIGPEGCD